MKRVIISGALLLLCAGISVYTMYIVREYTDYIQDQVVAAKEALESEDFQNLSECLNNLTAFWDQKEEHLGHLVRHAQIDEISKSIAKLKALTNEDTIPELVAELDSIHWQISVIDRSERLKLNNLL